MRPNVHVLATAICAALLSAAGAARAADVAVLPVEGSNLQPGELDAIGALVANAFAAESGIDVARPADTARALAEAGNLPAALARLGAREYVETTAIQLTSRITVRTVLRDAAGNFIHSAELTAASLDDVPPVATRLSRALVRRAGVERARTSREAAREAARAEREAARAEREAAREARREWQAQNRTFTEKVFGLKTATLWPRADQKNFDPSISLQFDGRLESRWGFLEFGAGAVIPTDGSDRDGLGGVFAEFGGSVYFVDAPVSPYLGLGIVPRLYFTSDGGGANAAAYGQFGMMFMRQSSSRLYVELRATRALTPIEEELGYDWTTDTYLANRSIYPLEVAMQVGIGW